MINVQKEIQIDASPVLVFDAISDPNKIVQYYPVDAVRSDNRSGGQIIFQGKVDGQAFTDYGVIDVFDPPREFSYSYWSDNHGTERHPDNHMTIRYLLSDSEQGTRLILEHRNLLSDERRNMMMGVWDFLLAQLKAYVEQK